MKLRKLRPQRSEILGCKNRPANNDVARLDVDRWRQGLGYLTMFAGLTVMVGSLADNALGNTEDKNAPRQVPERVARLAEKLARSCSKPELLRRQSNYRLPSQKGQMNMIELLTGTDTCPGTPIPAGSYTANVPYTDTGTTTGANSTVTFVQANCIEGPQAFYEQVAGPDHIYSFFLTARGANAEIRVTPGNATYDTSAFILSSTGTACPAGTANDVTNCLTGSDLQLGGEAEAINATKMGTLPLNQQLFLFVDGFYATPTNVAAGPYTVRIQDVTISTGAPQPPANDAPVDINGDGKTDFVTVRTASGSSGQATWYTSLQDGFPTSPTDWGLASDFFVSGDFDGDGRDDFAVWRPGAQGVFYIVRSATSTLFSEPFGQTGDDPSVVADYTGDNRDDLAVYRGGATTADQSNWYYRSIGSAPGFETIPWGQGGDTPAPGDYDGDGKADFVIQRANGVNGLFWKRMNTGAQNAEPFGLATDLVVPGDYDDDGKTDLAVVRPDAGFLRWDFEPSGTPGLTVVTDVWGVAATDIVAQGDYDGDGKTEYAIWRPGSPGQFWMMTVGTRSITNRFWGLADDYPVAFYNAH